MNTESGERLRSRLAVGDVVLPAFTDEELAAARPDGADLLGVRTDCQGDAAGREVALATARRTLLARGHLVEEVGVLWPTGPLQLVTALRAHPSRLVMIRREAGDRVDQRWLYGLADLAVLDESLDPMTVGVHRFRLRCGARTAASVVRFARAEASCTQLVAVSGDGSTLALAVEHGPSGLRLATWNGADPCIRPVSPGALASVIERLLLQESLRSRSS